MILIADSGSTKTDWALVDSHLSPLTSFPSRARLPVAFHHSPLTTRGLNPYHWTEEGLTAAIGQDLLPHVEASEVTAVYFYGSGVTPEMRPVMERAIRSHFPALETVEAESDLLGAARALCGHGEGIAAILGTGSNSCLYDGERILQNTPSLGYILGDEGGGATMGRLFLTALYKGFLSEEFKRDFEAATGLTQAEVIRRVYREPQPNAFLASLSEYIHSHRHDEIIHELLVSHFEGFFVNNISFYHRRQLPVSFVGSIAHYYQQELREAASRQHYLVGTILHKPLEALVDYHLPKA